MKEEGGRDSWEKEASRKEYERNKGWLKRKEKESKRRKKMR